MNNLGEIFRQIRISKNWSIREAAKRMGISYSYLSILEKGIDPRTGKDSNPKPDTLRIISKAYDHPYEELLKAAGYLNDDYKAEKQYDHTVFISNLHLIMGDMDIPSLSEDIQKKTGYNVSPSQIQSYLSGDIEPFPGTINILSRYARVSSDFWYMFNTEETLEKERKLFDQQVKMNDLDQHSKDYKIFMNLSDDLRKWLTQEKSVEYLKVAMEAMNKNVQPSSLKLIIDTLLTEREKKSF